MAKNEPCAPYSPAFVHNHGAIRLVITQAAFLSISDSGANNNRTYGGAAPTLIKQEEAFHEISARLIGPGYVQHCKLRN